MKCMVYVAVRRYSQPGPCSLLRDVRKVRWAPTPLTTRIVPLCATHRKRLERGDRLPLTDGTRL